MFSLLKFREIKTSLLKAVLSKRRMAPLALIGASVILAGCATQSTIRSNVTTFHQWPAELQDKTYVFDPTKEQENSLEYQSYADLVRAELSRHGFKEVQDLRRANLKATMDYGMQVRDVRVVQPVVVDPYPYPYFYGSAWRGYYGPYHYGPFYDPFWYGPRVVQQHESNYQLFTRHFKFALARTADGKRLYETTVVSEGRNGSLPAVMPYMIRSAFAEFPGQSGVPRKVELTVDK